MEPRNHVPLRPNNNIKKTLHFFLSPSDGLLRQIRISGNWAFLFQKEIEVSALVSEGLSQDVWQDECSQQVFGSGNSNVLSILFIVSNILRTGRILGAGRIHGIKILTLHTSYYWDFPVRTRISIRRPFQEVSSFGRTRHTGDIWTIFRTPEYKDTRNRREISECS